MTKEEAFNIIDQATAQANLPRLAHIQVQQALNVIKEALEPKQSEE